MKYSNVHLFLVLCTIVALSGCDTLGLNGDDPPPQRTISVRAESPAGTLVNGTITFGGTVVNDDGTADSTAVQSDETVTIAATASGRLPADTTVSWNQNHDITLILPEDNPENVSVPVSATATDADTAVASDYYLVREGRKDSLLTEDRKKDVVVLPFQEEPVTIRAEAKYFAFGTDQLQLDSDNPSAEIGLDRELVPVTLTAFAAGPDSTIAADYYDGDSRVAEAQTEASVILDYRPEPTELKAKATYFKTASKKLQPAANQRIKFGLERKSVTVAVLLKTMAEAADLSSANVTINDPNGDSTTCTGKECSKNLPAQAGQREIRITNRDTHPETGDIRRYDPYAVEFPAYEDWDESAVLEALLACNDGISNDINTDGDTLVDVWRDVNGDGRPSEGDVGDPGCLSKNDDHEGHFIFTLSVTNVNRNLWISSADGEREEKIVDRSSHNPLPKSAKDAVGDLLLSVENKREATKLEEFHIELNTGSKNNLNHTSSSEVIADADSIDGWHFANARGIDKSSFPGGTYFTITAVYNSPSGNVVFLYADGEGRTTVLSYAYEEEDYTDINSSAAGKKAATEQCQTTGRVRVCQQVSSGGYVRY